jgi:hypothetical protein
MIRTGARVHVRRHREEERREQSVPGVLDERAAVPSAQARVRRVGRARGLRRSAPCGVRAWPGVASVGWSARSRRRPGTWPRCGGAMEA